MDALVMVLVTLFGCAVVILLPAMMTGDWHADRCDRIERGIDG